MATPAVSVIMNCLNGERYLPAALNCLKSQTFQDFEIVFWDNCGTDGSADLAQAYGPQLRYYRGTETVPLGAARNLAIARSSGEFIAFLDCDDLWRPTKLEAQIALFRANPHAGLVCTDTEVSSGQKFLYRLFDRSAPARGMVFEELLTRQWISMSSAMIRRSALDDVARKNMAANGANSLCWFDESLNVCEEADLFYRIAHDWNLDYVAQPLTVWRVHGANTTFSKFGQFGKETMAILDKHRKLYPDYDNRHADMVELLTTRAAFQQAVAKWRECRNAEARRLIAPHVAKSLKYRLFWAASFLPGSTFDFMSRIYFALPAWLRK